MICQSCLGRSNRFIPCGDCMGDGFSASCCEGRSGNPPEKYSVVAVHHDDVERFEKDGWRVCGPHARGEHGVWMERYT